MCVSVMEAFSLFKYRFLSILNLRPGFVINHGIPYSGMAISRRKSGDGMEKV
jgi:hypothetical protein